MKIKKKFLSVLLMLTCVISLTACGAEERTSEFQSAKIDYAEQRSNIAIQATLGIIQGGFTDEILSDYNNVELGDVFGSFVANYGDSSFRAKGKAVRSAVSSFSEGLDTMGAIVEYGTPESVVKGDQIIVTIPVTGIDASGSVELIFSNDIYMEMESCTLNLERTRGQLMAKAGLNTLIGMCTVFAVLILISIIISLFGFIPKIQEAFKKKPEPSVASTPAPAPVAAEEEELADDTELVAVIAAAIAAYEGTSTDGFTVRSIKRANTRKWQKA